MERTSLRVDFRYMAQSLSGSEYALLDLVRSKGKADFAQVTHGTNPTLMNVAIYTLEQKALCETKCGNIILTDYGNKVHDIIDADASIKSSLISSALCIIMESETPRENEVGINMRQALEMVRH